MSRKVDDLSQDPFAEDNMPEQQSIQEDMMDVAVDKAKTSASNYVREAPKRFGRRMFWSIILTFTFNNQDTLRRDRLLDRLERGDKVSGYEIFFGEKFSIFGIIRWIIFLGLFGGIAYYLWSSGTIDMIMEQQALIEGMQGTATP